jgi:ATP phosphoribosyltransferase regulatory subunit
MLNCRALSQDVASAAGFALEHPLPAGMRDLLPEEAKTLRSLGRRVLECFERHGYERVTLPVFEYAAVLERGLGALDPREVLRFVEPESGEVVALRPDMTPQIARIVATRLRDVPAPARLAYEGSVVRLRRERARRHRQIPQAGIELIGSAAPDGDMEVLGVATAAMRAAGLEDFVLDLGHARIAGALLENVPAERRPPLVEALAAKDAGELGRRGRAAGLDAELSRALEALTELSGGTELWPAAESALHKTPASAALTELRRRFDEANTRSLAPRISVDLGEVRDFGYYTGVTFQILAEGPGEPIGSGGRYDHLLAAFGAARPAAGFAVALDDLSWALGRRAPASEPRLLIARSGDAVAHCGALRARGLTAAAAPADAFEYARAWRYSHVLEIGDGDATLTRLADGATMRLAERDPELLAERIFSLVSERTGP